MSTAVKESWPMPASTPPGASAAPTGPVSSDFGLPSSLQIPELVKLEAPAGGTPSVINTERGLRRVAQVLSEQSGPVAVDTERASGIRYGQRAFLVQLKRGESGVIIIDPEAFEDLSPVNDALSGVEWVLHAATQDLPCLAELGMYPDALFDTEMGGRLAGFERVGLGFMVENLLGFKLAKEHSSVDWSKRPLPEEWLNYAALDVEILLDLREAVEEVLREQDKLGYALEEFRYECEVRAAAGTRRGRERGAVEDKADMSIDDMVSELRRTRGEAGGEGMRLAERIAKDAGYDDDLEYMEENAEKLARRVHKSEASLKNMAVGEYQRMQRALESCPLCHHEDRGRPPLAPLVALATRVFLTLATEPEVSEGGAVIVPITHHVNLLECDDDEWEEIRNFMKSLTRMYHDQGRDVLFYENAAAPQRRMHAAMVAVPIPYQEGATAPAHFREAFLSADEEWSQHAKVIDTGARARQGLGRMAFRRSLAKEMPYFHVWFDLDGGLGHVVEDADRWPRGDLFAREVVGGIVYAEPHVVKRQGRWTRGDGRVDAGKRDWRKFDWTRLLTNG